MSKTRPALLDAVRPARFAGLLTLLGAGLLPWTLYWPDSPFGPWWVLSVCLPAFVTMVLAPRESVETLRWCRECALGRVDATFSGFGRSPRLHLPRAGAGAVRVRLRRSQGVRNPARRAA